MMRYAGWQHAFLRENFSSHSNEELARMATQRFGVEVTPGAMLSYGKNHHLRKDPGVRERAISRAIGSVWSPERDRFLSEYVPGHTQSETIAAFRERFGIELTVGQLKNRKAVLGLRSGTLGGRFERGNVPPNRGKAWADYMPEDAQERCRATQFRKGDLPHNTLPVGSERVTSDGYVEVKVAMRPSGRTAHDNWVPKARLVWERENGCSVPEGSMVVFLDGDPTNLDPANLALETRAEHAVIARNHMAYADRWSHEVAVAIARLMHASSEAREVAGHGGA